MVRGRGEGGRGKVRFVEDYGARFEEVGEMFVLGRGAGKWSVYGRLGL